MVMDFLDGLQCGSLAARASARRWHCDYLIDARRLGPLPGWVAERSAALFALRRRTRKRRHRGPASFELAAMQGLKLGLELLVLQLERFGVPPLLSQFLIQFCQLILVVTFGAVDCLITMKDPASG